jgi:hypothetical protein
MDVENTGRDLTKKIYVRNILTGKIPAAKFLMG